MLLGAAMLLSQHKDALNGGAVKFLFQPAEEESERGGEAHDRGVRNAYARSKDSLPSARQTQERCKIGLLCLWREMRDGVQRSTYPITYNYEKASEKVFEILRQIKNGSRVVETPPILGAEDFSRFLESAPGTFSGLETSRGVALFPITVQVSKWTKMF